MNSLKSGTIGFLLVLGIGGAWFASFDDSGPDDSPLEIADHAAAVVEPPGAPVRSFAPATAAPAVRLTPLRVHAEQLKKDDGLRELLRSLQLDAQQESTLLEQLVGIQRQAAMLRRSSSEHGPLLLSRLREFTKVSLRPTLNDEQMNQLFESHWLESLFTPNER